MSYIINDRLLINDLCGGGGGVRVVEDVTDLLDDVLGDDRFFEKLDSGL